MPKLGEIRRGQDIGKKTGLKYIWHACGRCSKERWVVLEKGKPRSFNCLSCRKGWRGNGSGDSRCITKEGYVFINIIPTSLYYEMRYSKNRVLEHRLVMAQKLGRCLLSVEHVHHLNGIRDDNRVENLQLISQANHTLVSAMCSNCELRKEIRLLRWQVRELTVLLQGKVEPLCIKL